MYDYKHPSVVAKATHSFTSAATVATFSVERSSDVYALSAVVYTAPTVTATVLTFVYQPTPGSATGAVTLGTLTIPVGGAIGNVYKRNIKPYSIPEGGELLINVTTTSTAGAGQAYYIFGEDPASDMENAKIVIVNS
jgi:hypothetical protein